jgi:acyl-CoA reductase-like NAD-dependent aldehyde dehydrogenase
MICSSPLSRTRASIESLIVDRSARLDTIIEPVVKGGYYHAGQVS